VFAAQEQIFGQIEIHLNPNPPTGGEEAESSENDIIAGDQRQVDAPAGQYVTDAPVSTEPPATDDSEPTQEDEDEPGTETQGTAD
jgi:hypothetical protein